MWKAEITLMENKIDTYKKTWGQQQMVDWVCWDVQSINE